MKWLLLVVVVVETAIAFTTRSSSSSCAFYRTCLFNERKDDLNEMIRIEDRDVPITHRGLHDDLYGDGEDHNNDNTASPSLDKPPTFNGKVIFPLSVITKGLNGHKVAAVYAVLNNQYKRGSGDGWEYCEYVGVTRNLELSLRSHIKDHGNEKVSYIRALSFAYPQRSAMENLASEWKMFAKNNNDWSNTVKEAMTPQQQMEYQAKKDKLRKAMADPTLAKEQERKGGGNDVGDEDPEKRRQMLIKAMERTAFFDSDSDDDDDDDDDDDWSMEVAAQSLETMKDTKTTIVSPFSSNSYTFDSNGLKEFTKENVDKVLDEVRPYLIADGGNVSVQRIDESTKSIYLIMEGACGSCASSTVTMKMGIERVLMENFGHDIGEVVQVQNTTTTDKPTQLTWDAVQNELNRISPAIKAMGGTVEIIKVDPIGLVQLRYHGSNKIKQGLELAIRDVPYVKHVEFVM